MSESKAREAIRKEQEELFSRVSSEIQTILESNGVALQPFMNYSEFGVTPRVRLVATNIVTNEPTNDTGADSESGTGGEPEDKPAQAE